ncbi:HNH endonuclease [Clostridium botulinum]|uniref:HNH endonuclease n=1 Tax=Clostridium botulinum TaxID=1491 RepID=UPI001967FA90|nr:HNH endonuclease [Clostridium botulinum]MBN1065537.1 hypothetical protein [Clostridium botulinum]
MMNALIKMVEIPIKESGLYELSKNMDYKITDIEELDKPIAKEIPTNSFLPKERDSEGNKNGTWSDERGNSDWYPESDKVPGKANEEGKSWGEILDKYDIDKITFKDGEPDFSPISRATVEIEDFTTDRQKNFMQADEAEAKKRGCTPGEVKQWRKENGYTWHERKDCTTMDKVPSEVHNNIPHAGGISEKKKEL